MLETERIGEFLRVDKESIKLVKNTKGYNWEIKILETNIERLKDINQALIEEFDMG